MESKMKKKWIKALRSGDYDQTDQKMVSHDDKFCCLGVLCNISGAGEWIEPGNLFNIDWLYLVEINGVKHSHFGHVPDKYADSIGLSESDQVMLANMNDDGDPFSKIADYIEEYL